MFLVALARAERGHRAPLVDGSLLRSGRVGTANVLLAVNAGMLFFTTLYLQGVLGYSPLAVGAAFAPITVVILLLSPRVGALLTTVGVRRLLTIGFTLSALGWPCCPAAGPRQLRPATGLLNSPRSWVPQWA